MVSVICHHICGCRSPAEQNKKRGYFSSFYRSPYAWLLTFERVYFLVKVYLQGEGPQPQLCIVWSVTDAKRVPKGQVSNLHSQGQVSNLHSPEIAVSYWCFFLGRSRAAIWAVTVGTSSLHMSHCDCAFSSRNSENSQTGTPFENSSTQNFECSTLQWYEGGPVLSNSAHMFVFCHMDTCMHAPTLTFSSCYHACILWQCHAFKPIGRFLTIFDQYCQSALWPIILCCGRETIHDLRWKSSSWGWNILFNIIHMLCFIQDVRK